ncbi:MAG: 2-C-methyl-D-erythritol 2,4-cyclodiphosphate synthase [Granulosicoccaceae bacterium]
MLIGHGYDVHAFGPGNSLVIGGQSIPFEHAFVAHSDGDVLIHALCDALLGAAGLGDIGYHFPDTDEAWKGADSRDLLARVLASLADQGLTPHNADMTIIAQAPKMAPHINAMRETLAADLGLELRRVNVKATTSEHLGFTGRSEGIAAHAVVTVSEAS